MVFTVSFLDFHDIYSLSFLDLQYNCGLSFSIFVIFTVDLREIYWSNVYSCFKFTSSFQKSVWGNYIQIGQTTIGLAAPVDI